MLPTNKKSSVGELLRRDHGIRDVQARLGTQPKDHTRDNRRTIKALEEKNRTKRNNEENEKQKKMFKLKQYENIPSKISSKTSKNNTEKSIEYYENDQYDEENNHIEENNHNDNEEEYDDNNNEKIEKMTSSNRLTKPAVPIQSSFIPIRNNIDYISDNMKNLPKNLPKSSWKKEEFGENYEHDPKKINPEFGKVPLYVLERKLEKQQEKINAEIAAKIALETPPGMRILPENERLETLANLEIALKNAEIELGKLPIVLSTFSLKKRKTDLEKQIAEIEAGIKTFSRKKVFIALEEN